MNEVIEAIDNQLSKQDDIQKKKVSHGAETCTFYCKVLCHHYAHVVQHCVLCSSVC